MTTNHRNKLWTKKLALRTCSSFHNKFLNHWINMIIDPCLDLIVMRNVIRTQGVWTTFAPIWLIVQSMWPSCFYFGHRLSTNLLWGRQSVSVKSSNEWTTCTSLCGNNISLIQSQGLDSRHSTLDSASPIICILPVHDLRILWLKEELGSSKGFHPW